MGPLANSLLVTPGWIFATPLLEDFQAGKPRPGGGGTVLEPMGACPAPSRPRRPGNHSPQPCDPPSHGVRRAARCVLARATCPPAAATFCACRGTRAFPGREWGTSGRAPGSSVLGPPCPCLPPHLLVLRWFLILLPLCSLCVCAACLSPWCVTVPHPKCTQRG